MTAPLPRREIARISVPSHGGRSALGDRANIARLDFSVCLNAHGPAPLVRAAVERASIDEYPDPHAVAARRVAAEWCGVSLDMVDVGAGATALIHALCFAYLRPRDRAIVAAPAFAEYEHAARLCGAQVHRHESTAQTGLRLRALRQAITLRRPRLVFIATPSSPFGRRVSLDDATALANVCAEVGALLVVDQSYDAFCDAPSGVPLIRNHASVAHVRSLTKDHALAGVRVAFMVAAPTVVRAVQAARPAWSTSAAAQAAACAAMMPDALAHVSATTRALRAEASRMRLVLRSAGFDVADSETHYFLVGVGEARGVADRLLAAAGILVRDCNSFGLPRHIRIAARLAPDNDRLLSAMKELVTS